jgi:hypothetical protein
MLTPEVVLVPVPVPVPAAWPSDGYTARGTSPC